MFDIDLNKYELVDLSTTVQAGQAGDRPFLVERGLLADGAYKYDIRTHSHVGTHVEFPAHFYGDHKRGATDYPLSTFMGRAILCRITNRAPRLAITAGDLQREIGDIIAAGDIVVFRNDGDRYAGDVEAIPYFTAEAARWLRSQRVKLIILDVIRMGTTIAEGREFHDILMGDGAEVPFVEIVDNLDALKRRVFYVICPPYKVKGLDSSFCRVVAVQEK
jgi:arylformamidase